MSSPADEPIIESSGNVFRDMGRPEADLLLLKAQLAAQISTAITRRGWTQSQAAEHLGVDQPRISSLVRGRLSGFSTDALLGFLKRLDVRVSVTIEDPDVQGLLAPGEAQARVEQRLARLEDRLEQRIATLENRLEQRIDRLEEGLRSIDIKLRYRVRPPSQRDKGVESKVVLMGDYAKAG